MPFSHRRCQSMADVSFCHNSLRFERRKVGLIATQKSITQGSPYCQRHPLACFPVVWTSTHLGSGAKQLAVTHRSGNATSRVIELLRDEMTHSVERPWAKYMLNEGF